MSKEQLIAELEKLTPTERWDLFDHFWPAELRGPSEEEEKALLDRELEDYRKNPNACIPWSEVKAQLQRDREQAR
jgi:putative addiction module component (TIGR02574 family)